MLGRLNNVGLGTTSGYLASYQVGSAAFSIQRIDNESPTLPQSGATSLDDTAFVTLLPANDYRIIFRGSGALLAAEVFDLSDLSTALASVTAADATYVSGAAGLLSAASVPSGLSNGTDVTFDNFFASVPEPASLGVLAAAGVGLLARRRR